MFDDMFRVLFQKHGNSFWDKCLHHVEGCNFAGEVPFVCLCLQFTLSAFRFICFSLYCSEIQLFQGFTVYLCKLLPFKYYTFFVKLIITIAAIRENCYFLEFKCLWVCMSGMLKYLGFIFILFSVRLVCFSSVFFFQHLKHIEEPVIVCKIILFCIQCFRVFMYDICFTFFSLN